MRINKKVLFTLLVLIILAGSVWVYTEEWMENGLHPPADGTNDYAIILGAKVNGETPSLSLQYRLEKALAYAEQYPHVKFVLSGGQGHDEMITEAEAMRRFFVRHQIGEERLILEEKSTSTYENLTYSLEMLPDSVESLTIISSDFHLARAKFIAKKLSVEVDVLAAKTPKIVEMKSRTRERVALIKTAILGK